MASDWPPSGKDSRMSGVTIVGPSLGAAPLCEPILRALPRWFGIPEATAQYIRDIDTMPTLTALKNEICLGFLALRRFGKFAADIHVMGVMPDCHHQGFGRHLVTAAEAFLAREGVEYLQVKTLSPSRSDANYDLTRRFYLALGFRPLDEFPTLWGEANPCLQLIKKIK